MVEVTSQLNNETISSLVEALPNVLKQDDSFAIIDQRGNIRPLHMRDHGLFRDGTRFLSHLALRIGGQMPQLLSSAMNADADILHVDLTNANIDAVKGAMPDTLHLRETSFLWNNTLYLQVAVHNYGTQQAYLPLSVTFEADYKDIFEVRGQLRDEHGKHYPALVEDATLKLRYMGLDKIERQTHLHFSPRPAHLSADTANYELRIDAGEYMTLRLAIACRYADEDTSIRAFDVAIDQLVARRKTRHDDICHIETSNTHFNAWVDASLRDLLLLLTETEHGLYPYAGVPWFSTVFGRDGIITALQTLWFYPEIARGVLATLAAKQATVENLERESEPGKILHEQRPGEMANTDEIPFGSYYGTVDATPLFVVLAGRYYERTGDRAFIKELWPAIEAALSWIDTYGDIDGDGFVEYRRKNEAGILQQGWKDSNDSVFYADGTLVNPPVALCEVQGYVYEAKTLAAEIAESLGKMDTAQNLRNQATALHEKFQQAFWLDDLGTYAIALDGDKQPCRVRTSNAGHCLYSGIADPQHAQRIVDDMLSADFFSGWGIRTLAAKEIRYNPIAYHNGTVWPHDNALIAAGMARYGFKDAASQVLTALFETSTHVDLYRLPELFCGFERQAGEGPIRYPVACLPQAWAAGSVFLILQACLGIRIDGLQNQIIFDQPMLPLGMDTLNISNLPIGAMRISLMVHRSEGKIKISQIAGKTITIVVQYP